MTVKVDTNLVLPPWYYPPPPQNYPPKNVYCLSAEQLTKQSTQSIDYRLFIPFVYSKLEMKKNHLQTFEPWWTVFAIVLKAFSCSLILPSS